ncbi:MAG: type II toxin-antitoxin system RelE family toxin [Sciscionella sp.]
MTRWRLQTSPQFDKAARRLDRAVLRRVRTYLDEVCQLDDPRQRGKGLTGDLSGYWRYRAGDWRVIAEIRDDELVIIAIGLDHRSKIYRGR